MYGVVVVCAIDVIINVTDSVTIDNVDGVGNVGMYVNVITAVNCRLCDVTIYRDECEVAIVGVAAVVN